MISILTNLTKAAVAVALTPVAIAADVVRLPFTAEDFNGKAFGLTEKLLNNAIKSIDEATK